MRSTKILCKLKIDFFKQFLTLFIFFTHWTIFNSYLVSAPPSAPSSEYTIVIIYRSVRDYYSEYGQWLIITMATAVGNEVRNPWRVCAYEVASRSTPALGKWNRKKNKTNWCYTLCDGESVSSKYIEGWVHVNSTDYDLFDTFHVNSISTFIYLKKKYANSTKVRFFFTWRINVNVIY